MTDNSDAPDPFTWAVDKREYVPNLDTPESIIAETTVRLMMQRGKISLDELADELEILEKASPRDSRRDAFTAASDRVLGWCGFRREFDNRD